MRLMAGSTVLLINRVFIRKGLSKLGQHVVLKNLNIIFSPHCPRDVHRRFWATGRQATTEHHVLAKWPMTSSVCQLHRFMRSPMNELRPKFRLCPRRSRPSREPASKRCQRVKQGSKTNATTRKLLKITQFSHFCNVQPSCSRHQRRQTSC